MPSVVLSDGARVVTVEEVQEHRPKPAPQMAVLPSVTGELIIYEKVGRLCEVPIAGRVKTRDEVTFLEDFIADAMELSVTERDGTITSGWRIKTDPQPNIHRKDGDSADWMITITLWRLP